MQAEYWIFDTSVLTETYPVVIINTQEQYFILMNYDGVGYLKVEWSMVSDNQMSVSVFIASSAWDAHTTIEEAINDTTPEIGNAIFTKIDDGA